MANAVRRPPDKAMSAGGRFLPIMVTRRAGQIGCNRWSERMQMTGQVECKRVVKWSAISQSSDMVASPVLVEIVAATKKMARMRAGQMGILQRSRVNLRSAM